MKLLQWASVSLCAALSLLPAHASKPDLPDWVTQAAAAVEWTGYVDSWKPAR